MNKKIRCVTYEKRHEEIIESGINEISYALYNGNTEEKASLLLCLDKYLDPYYGYNLKYESQIIILLQNLLFNDNDIEINEDILELLQLYSKQPLNILEEKMELLPKQLVKQAMYILYDEKSNE